MLLKIKMESVSQYLENAEDLLNLRSWKHISTHVFDYKDGVRV